MKHVVDVPSEVIEEVYIGFKTPISAVTKISQIVGVGDGTWKLTHTDSHAYRMQTTVTSILNRTTYIRLLYILREWYSSLWPQCYGHRPPSHISKMVLVSEDV